MILTPTASATNNSQFVANDFAAGYFDASIGLSSKSNNTEYWKGYLAYTTQTDKIPF